MRVSSSLTRSPYRITLAVTAVLLLAAATGLIWSASAMSRPPNRPGVYAENPVVDFGELNQGDVREAEFALVNHFPQPIAISDVLTGCSCTQAVLSDKEVPAGGRFTVAVKWSVGVRRGPLSDGVNLLYRAPDGQQKMAKLGLTATVIPDIHYAPNVLEFAPAVASTVVVQLSPGRRDPFVLKHATATQEAFRVALDAPANAVTVAFDPAKWVDIGADPWLSIETDSERQPTLTIPLRVQRPEPKAMPAAMPGGGGS